jgi:hypothetical protein
MICPTCHNQTAVIFSGTYGMRCPKCKSPSGVEKSKSSHGGEREGSGRKPSGKKPYMTRLRQEVIDGIKDRASTFKAECEFVEMAILKGWDRVKPRTKK